METEKEIEYKSTIMEMRNIIKNQERVINTLPSKKNHYEILQGTSSPEVLKEMERLYCSGLSFKDRMRGVRLFSETRFKFFGGSFSSEVDNFSYGVFLSRVDGRRKLNSLLERFSPIFNNVP